MESNKICAEIQELLLQESNSKCFDCGISSPLFVSINNSIFLCSNCSKNHYTLGSSISIIKSIENEVFIPLEIKFLQIGGNARFSKLLDEYQVPASSLNNYILKYHLQIADYYRKLLYAEVTMNQTKIEYLLQNKPSLDIGKMQMNDNCSHCEIKKNEDISENSDIDKNPFKAFFFNIGEKISNIKEKFNNTNDSNNFAKKIVKGAETITTKLSQMEIQPLIKKIENRAINIAKKTDTFLKNKSNSILQSSFFKNKNQQFNPYENVPSSGDNNNNNNLITADIEQPNISNQDAAAPVIQCEQMSNSNQLSQEEQKENEEPLNVLHTIESNENNSSNNNTYFIDINQI